MKAENMARSMLLNTMSAGIFLRWEKESLAEIGLS